jgi:hypothetical protein
VVSHLHTKNTFKKSPFNTERKLDNIITNTTEKFEWLLANFFQAIQSDEIVAARSILSVAKHFKHLAARKPRSKWNASKIEQRLSFN